jgi:siroheme synthase (precorrin-2 oxidase/ferrochelatase)
MRIEARGLPISLDLEGQKVLLVGKCDAETARKREFCIEAGATVQTEQKFSAADLDGARLVLLAEREPKLAAKVHAAARKAGVLCWCADDPVHSDFAFPAIARMGDARVSVSTAGRSPALAARMRESFEAQLGERFARFVAGLGQHRAATKKQPPEARRRARRVEALDGFRLELRVSYPDWFTAPPATPAATGTRRRRRRPRAR